jgi:hypothetical protein
MKHGLSDQVRAAAEEKYVYPAIQAGRARFSIAVRDLMGILEKQGFPARNWPQICTAIQADKFLRTNRLEIESVEGPPSKLSTTVVVRYRVVNGREQAHPGDSAPAGPRAQASSESPEEWAKRVTEKMRGLLKDEIAGFGGTEAFIRWVRSDDEGTE